MKFLDENGKWIFATHKADGSSVRKRAEFLSALKSAQIDLQGTAQDLAELEYAENEAAAKRTIARLALVQLQLQLIEKHLFIK